LKVILIFLFTGTCSFALFSLSKPCLFCSPFFPRLLINLITSLNHATVHSVIVFRQSEHSFSVLAKIEHAARTCLNACPFIDHKRKKSWALCKRIWNKLVREKSPDYSYLNKLNSKSTFANSAGSNYHQFVWLTVRRYFEYTSWLIVIIHYPHFLLL